MLGGKGQEVQSWRGKGQGVWFQGVRGREYSVGGERRGVWSWG